MVVLRWGFRIPLGILWEWKPTHGDTTEVRRIISHFPERRDVIGSFDCVKSRLQLAIFLAT